MMKKFTLGLGCLLASGFLCSPAMAQEWGNYNSEPFTMPADVEAVECQLNFYDPDFNEIQRLVNVAITDEFIYIQGFSEYLPEAVVRLEYNTKLGVAFLMQDEYVGDYEGCPYYTRLYEMDWEEMQMVPISLNAEGLPFEVDPEECTLRAKGGSYYYWYLTFYTPDGEGDSFWAEGCLDFIQNIAIEPFIDQWGTPAAPYDLTFDAETGLVSFVMPDYTIDDVEMSIDDLYYYMYVNGELVKFDGYDGNGHYSGLWGSGLVPYDFSNDEDVFCDGMNHSVILFMDDIETIGVESVYRYGNALHPFDIIYSDRTTINVNGEDDPTGIDKISADVVNTEFFTTDGKKVNNPENGIFIKRSILSNGQVIVNKVVRK